MIDDFTTYGTSCETVRNVLEKEEVGQVVFIALGKYGKTYLKYDYELKGNLFGTYTYNRVLVSDMTGTFNPFANKEFLDSIKGLV